MVEFIYMIVGKKNDLFSNNGEWVNKIIILWENLYLSMELFVLKLNVG